MKKSAGVIIILNKTKMLMCHSTNSKWNGTFSVPKGGIDKGESKIDAALRELKEETSVKVKKRQLYSEKPIIFDYTSKKGVVYKRLFLYKVYIDDISEIGLETEIIPYDKLQKNEIDWCGFLNKEEATKKIFHRVENLLDLI
mgnify:CR=1 FL=1